MDVARPDQFGALFDAAPLGMVAVDGEGRIIRVNAALERIFGYASGALLGELVEILLPEQLREGHVAQRRAFLSRPEPRSMGPGRVLQGRHRSGQCFPIEVSITHLPADAGGVAVAFIADVSERLRLEGERDALLERERQARVAAEEAARKHEAALAQLHTLVQSAPIGVAVLDTELCFQLINDQLAQLNGAPAETHLGRSLRELYPRLGARIEPLMREVLVSGEPQINRQLSGPRNTPLGRQEQFLASIYPVRPGEGPPIGVGVLVQNITSWLEAEEARRLSDERFHAIFANAPLGMVLTDIDGVTLDTNPAFRRLVGYEVEELHGRGPRHFIHPDDFPALLRVRNAFLRGERDQRTIILRYVRKDGAIIRVSATASFVQAEGAQYVLVITEDVTERHAADETRARLAAIVDSTDDAIVGATLDGTVFSWNAAAERLYGYTAVEMVGRSKLRIIPASRREELRAIEAVVARGEAVARIESTRVHKSGRTLEVSLTFSPIVDSAGQIIGVSTIARDIGERKRVERLLERQAALSHLIQVVAVAANQATSVHTALQTAVDTICATLGWPVGHVYLAEDGAGEPLVSSDIWHLDTPSRFHAFQAITEALAHPTPDDLPGRVLLSGHPEWIADLAGAGLAPRFGLISDLGVRSGFAFPVLVGVEVAAVLEFFAGEPHAPDAALLEVMANVGAQLGRVIERDRAVRAVRKSEQLYRTLAGSIPNGAVLLFDHQLRFTVADGSALAALDMAREKLEGRTLGEAIPSEAFALLEPHYRTALRGERSQMEITARGRVYQSYFLPVEDERGGIAAGMCMSYDITELKHVERELREERALLARRVAERTADLSLANAELARAARLKDEFLANMSHELRTPLNAILGRAEILQEGIYGPVTPEQIGALRSIEESGRHLLSLINDILDLSKIEAGRLELEIGPVDVRYLCTTSLRMIAQLALMKRIAVTSSVEGPVDLLQGDERRLRQVLVNLLSNAVKFTPEGGSVALEVCGDAEQETITFHVRDTGIGIDQADLGKLFRPFVQIDSSLSRRYSGTGLGLALVLRLAEAHGGSVAVESAPGQGSRFSVALPLSRAADEERPRPETPSAPPLRQAFGGEAAPAEAAGQAGTHVLLAEDNEANIAVIQDYLRVRGFTVTVARNGGEAVAAVEELAPDIILMDIQMPGMDGLEAIRRIRARETVRAVPIVALTALAMRGDRERCLEAGADAYLAKPVRLDELRGLINRLARGAGARAG